jgi:hypothetical protein
MPPGWMVRGISGIWLAGQSLVMPARKIGLLLSLLCSLLLRFG